MLFNPFFKFITHINKHFYLLFLIIKYFFFFYRRALIYMYPFNVINWIKMVLIAGLISVCLGTVFAGIRWRFWDTAWQREPEFEQDNVTDRVGFNHVMSVVGVWVLLLHLGAEVWRYRGPVARDIQDDLYSKFAYIFTRVSFHCCCI